MMKNSQKKERKNHMKDRTTLIDVIEKNKETDSAERIRRYCETIKREEN